MMPAFLTNPGVTLIMGIVVGAAGIVAFLSSCAQPNRSQQFVESYKQDLNKTAQPKPPQAGSPEEKASIERFTTFLKNIGNKEYVKANTATTYAPDAYLNDTLVTRRGVSQIEAYFLKTAESLTDAEVTIDDVARTETDHYIRWTMVMQAKALAKGTPVHSVGMSQVRFDQQGRVTLHQDFWDSGDHFFGKLPVAGGVIGFIRKRLE